MVRLHGKGRKDRTVPILAGHRSSDPPLALTNRSCAGRVAVSGCQRRPAHTVGGSRIVEPRHQIRRRKVRPAWPRRSESHRTLFGTQTAMHLLQAGVDITLMPLWLGHESPATTQHLC